MLGEAISQTEAGADALDVNVGLPEIDEAATLVSLVGKIQGVSPLPLQIDSSDPVAVEAAVRVYSGKPIINSVNGKQESLDAVLPIAKHYGCAVVGLALDEQGIPPTAEGRFAVAQRIVEEADKYGIPRSDIFIDCLVMAASTNQAEVVEILRAITMVKERLGVRTVLGVSNVSFGLPLARNRERHLLGGGVFGGPRHAHSEPAFRALSRNRRYVARAMRARRLGAGLHFRIREQEHVGRGRRCWSGDGAGKRLGACARSRRRLRRCGRFRIAPFRGHGRKANMPEAVSKLLETCDAMEVINGHLIPALDDVGERFEKGKFFLPQLMASAEAAKAGFDVIKEQGGSGAVADKGSVAIATVKGDIHDIGKNIVRMLLENYGYTVYDLGRDVEPQAVLDCVHEHDIKLVGLSALMTTTVRGMEDTIALLREQAPDVKVFVGGAVITAEYAEMVGADYYCKDAAESAKVCGEVLGA